MKTPEKQLNLEKIPENVLNDGDMNYINELLKKAVSHH